ncbi:MAG: hypothetical protein HYS05_12950 [Acidobacteria bacterium]|nr:hypothetical protein [Acidobacteriota bacterium]
MRARLAAAGLLDIADRLAAGDRLTLEEGVRLFDSPDLFAVISNVSRRSKSRFSPTCTG